MTDPLYGPDKPCRRTACIEAARLADRYRRDRAVLNGADPADVQAQPYPEVGDHLGGAHLDPYDRAHYDGPVTSYKAAPLAVRTALKPLMILAGSFTDRYNTDGSRADSELRTAVDVAAQGCLDEIYRLGQQVAHVRVDADHKVRDAMRRADDCIEHGKMITDLEAQVTHFDRSQRRTEKARLALLGEHQAIRDFLDKYDTGQTREGLDVAALVDALRKMNRRASAAHDRAWKANTT